MLKKITAALGATMLVFGLIGGASASPLSLVGTNTINETDTYTFNSGGLPDGILEEETAPLVFVDDHTFDFDQTIVGGADYQITVQSINSPGDDPLSTTKTGIKNLTYTFFDDIGGFVFAIQISDENGNGCGYTDLPGTCALNPGLVLNSGTGSSFYVFTQFINEGASTIVVSGTAFGGGAYTLGMSAVPLPAAALLFGSALLGGGLMRRRKMIKEFGLPA